MQSFNECDSALLQPLSFNLSDKRLHLLSTLSNNWHSQLFLMVKTYILTACERQNLHLPNIVAHLGVTHPFLERLFRL